MAILLKISNQPDNEFKMAKTCGIVCVTRLSLISLSLTPPPKYDWKINMLAFLASPNLVALWGYNYWNYVLSEWFRIRKTNDLSLNVFISWRQDITLLHYKKLPTRNWNFGSKTMPWLLYSKPIICK